MKKIKVIKIRILVSLLFILSGLGGGFAQEVVVTSEEKREFVSTLEQDSKEGIIKNPSFEDNQLNDYKIENVVGEVSIAISDEEAYDGEKSLKFEGENASAFVLQSIPVEKNTVYRLTCWAKSTGLTGGNYFSLYLNGNTIDFINVVSERFPFRDNKWIKKEFILNTGETTILNLMIGYNLWRSGPGSGTVYFDNIQFEKITQTVDEYIVNERRRIYPGVPLELTQETIQEWHGTMEGGTPQYFRPTVESLRQYEAPEWFRDAKLGIFIVWGPYSVPAMNGEWFARNMYLEGSNEQKWVEENYGPVSEYGYKDIIQDWKAENFNPDEMVKTFKVAGAKYIVPIATFHDNFDLWDSRYHKWNAANMGPKKDIVGLFREATLKEGLRFGVTTHLARAYSWYNVNKLSYSEGPYKGQPYDGNKPEYEDLYLKNTGEIGHTIPINPDIKWRAEWICRIADLIDTHQPDLYYFDGSVPFRGYDQARSGLEILAYYYNENRKWNHGKNEAVMCIKHAQNGYFFDSIATLDFERGHAKEALSEPWQTDDAMTLGAWCYTKNAVYQEPITLLHKFIDIVSKNGNYLLAVGPKADGTLPQEVMDRLKVFGDWLAVNGEAIYETRPWDIAEEGEVRFTQSKDASKVFAIVLAQPEGKLNINALAAGKKQVNSVKMLGYSGKIHWKQASTSLQITMPKNIPCDYAWSFLIH
jgi:alpha-L-fucosidase